MKWSERKKKTVRATLPRRPSHKGSNRHIFHAFLALVLVAAIGVGGWIGYPFLWDYLCSVSHFKVTRITFTGLQTVQESELRALLPRVGGVNLFALNFPDLQSRLRKHPWVQDAKLRRDLPDKLLIDVTERKPVALLAREGLWALDVHGVVLPLEAGRGELDLPLVKADSGQTPLPGLALKDKQLAALLPKLDALHRRAPQLWSVISEVSWDPSGQLELYAFGHPAHILVGKDPTWRQMLHFYTFIVYQGRRSGLEDITLVDLRFPGQVVVRRTPAPSDSTVKPQS